MNGLPVELRERLVEMLATRIKDKPTSVAVCHSEPGAWHPAHYPTARCPPAEVKHRVGRTMFETDRVPEGWDLRMNEMDQIWVPTAFHERIFAEGGVEEDKLRVLGEPVDVSFFDPELHHHLPLPDTTPKTFVLLSVFKWETRKGWEVLLEAYWREFERSDDVLLVILTNAYHSESDFEDQALKFMQEKNLGTDLAQLARIYFHPTVPQTDLPALYAAADVFVLPSRGEGWGRPHVEAMSMELPVIATNWSGPTEYMTDDNSYPLAIDGLTTVNEGAFQGHMWAAPSVAHLRQLMRAVHQDPAGAKAKGVQARRDMVANYSPSVMGAKLAELLLDLAVPRSDTRKSKSKKKKKKNKSGKPRTIERTEIKSTHHINVEL